MNKPILANVRNNSNNILNSVTSAKPNLKNLVRTESFSQNRKTEYSVRFYYTLFLLKNQQFEQRQTDEIDARRLFVRNYKAIPDINFTDNIASRRK